MSYEKVEMNEQSCTDESLNARKTRIVYTLTTPNEMTDPGRESEKGLLASLELVSSRDG